MVIYLASFTICIAISFIIDRKDSKSFGYITGSLVIIAILSLVAGLRANSVGTDTSDYPLSLYNLACASDSFGTFYSESWFRFWQWVDVRSFEIGYLILVWIARCLGSFQVLLFLTSALTVGPIYYAFVKKRYDICLPICLILFLLIDFNWTLNAMRQWIAAAFVFLGVFALYEPGSGLLHQFKCVVAIFIAYLFHTSAIIGIGVLLIRVALINEKGFTRYCLITVGSILLLLFVGTVQSILSSIGLSKFAVYLGDGSVHFAVRGFVLQLPFFLLSIYYYKSRRASDKLALFYLCMMTVSLIASQIASLGLYSGRITLYIDIFEIPLVGSIVSNISKKVHVTARLPLLSQSVSSLFIYLFSFAYGLLYWFSVYATGSGETLPYFFFWQ